MKQSLLTIFLISIISLSAFAQISDRDKLYDDSQVARIDIFMAPSALDSMYTYTHFDTVYYCSIHFKNKYFDENVDNVAVRVRGNTSRDSQKKSIKLDFNEYIDNRYFHTVSSLNINAEHNDPSIVRSKLGWDFFNKIGLTASKAAHAELYINGKYYGLYISVESINKSFLKNSYADVSGNLWKCLWPADLNYLGDDPNLYKLMNGDRRVYELGTNEDVDDYSELARFIKIINQTPDNLLPDSLEKIFYLPELLKYYAVDQLFGSWDEYWYLKNNYYLYNEPNAKKIHIIPYDYDNCLGVDWFNIDWATINPYNRPFSEGSNYSRPLVTRIMANKQYRNLYTHFMQFYNNLFALSNWESRIDSFKQQLLPFAAADTMRTKDYGFTINDFLNSYSLSGYSNQHVKRGIKEFINTRNVILPGQLVLYNSQSPIVYDIKYFPQNPGPNDTIYVYAAAFCKEGFADLKINFVKNDQANFEYNMTYSPVLNTSKVEEADRWIGKIPPLGTGGSGKFIIAVK
ncbi:MAG: CotH kinase family protein, partial [Bacteroidota bacterium]|nr:CotH kinase family protein [Bacteroidota bacterium]